MTAKSDSVRASAAHPLRDQRKQIARFFKERRLAAGLSIEETASSLGLESDAMVIAYESAIEPIPLEMIFALTNLLNIPPEDTLNLIYDVHGMQGEP